MTRKNTIFLIGFSGSGKSSVGRALAKRLRTRFYDTDELITRKTGLSIPRIFADRGEGTFRRLEREAIAEITSKKKSRMVVAIGGGAFQDKENREIIAATGTVVYLSCSQTELYRRLRGISSRPMLYDKTRRATARGLELRQRIKKLLGKRLRYYKLADISVSTTGRTASQTATMLARKIAEINALN